MNNAWERIDLIEEDINSKSNWIGLLDNDKFNVSLNEYSPVMNDCRLGRYKQ